MGLIPRTLVSKVSLRRALSYLPALAILAGIGTCAYLYISGENSEDKLEYCSQVDQMLNLYVYATREYSDLTSQLEQNYNIWRNADWRDSMNTNKAIVFGISNDLMRLSEGNALAKALEEESLDFTISIVNFTASTEDILTSRPTPRLLSIGRIQLFDMNFYFSELNDAQIEYCH